MEMNWICLHGYYLEAWAGLTDEEVGRLGTAMLLYGKTGEIMDLPGNERFVFPDMKAQIDKDKADYYALCERQRARARKRWDKVKARDTNAAG